MQQREYDAWGRIVSETTAAGFSQPFGFAGGLRDTDAGLVRFGARDYDPGIGRWTSTDPIIFEGGTANVYEYAFVDPTNLNDPSGLDPYDFFPTPQDAAEDFGFHYNDISIREDREWGANIRCIAGRGCFYDEPWPGKRHEHPMWPDPDLDYSPFRRSMCDTDIVSNVHTHGNHSAGYNDEQPSRSDHRSCWFEECYLWTPLGSFLRYNNSGAPVPLRQGHWFY